MLDLDKDGINIKDLTFEAPKPPVFDIYNPQSFLKGDSFWKEVEVSRNNPGSTEYFRCVGRIRRLFPEQADRFSVSEDLWQVVSDMLADNSDEIIGSKSDYSDFAVAIKALSTDRFTKMVANTGGFEWLSKSYMGGLKGIPIEFDLAANIKILFPDRFSQLKWGEDEWRVGQLTLVNSREAGFFSNTATQTANLRVIFPEKLSELKLNPEELERYVNDLKNEQRSFGRLTFLDYLETLQILLADELQFTDQGLVPILPTKTPDFHTEVPLPIRRAF